LKITLREQLRLNSKTSSPYDERASGTQLLTINSGISMNTRALMRSNERSTLSSCLLFLVKCRRGCWAPCTWLLYSIAHFSFFISPSPYI